ncbi:MAG: tetratricopeptide repeat protein [Rhodothermales bacterium]|nr:tetratricopeptide repeat protein [Rhodothermales bacterium]
MAVVHRLPPRKPEKFGFKKAKRRIRGGNPRQLDIFSAASSARILSLPSRRGVFEEALLLDERGSQAAESAYRRAIEEGDCSADAYCNLGILRFHAGDSAEALSCFTNSLKENPRHFESHYNLANLFFDRGNLNAARVQYELASAIDDTFASLYFNFGLLLAIEEDYQGSFDAFIRFRSLAPEEEGRLADELLNNLRETLAQAG